MVLAALAGGGAEDRHVARAPSSASALSLAANPAPDHMARAATDATWYQHCARGDCGHIYLANPTNQRRHPRQRTPADFVNESQLLDVQPTRGRSEELEGRSIVGEPNAYRQLGIEPSLTGIGRHYGTNRHTVARY